MLHVSLVGLSLSLFFWGGIAMWQGKAIQSYIWQRRIPDSIDSILFISGVGLAYVLGFSPWHDSWLLVKLIALVAYIALGFMALRKGSSTMWLKRTCFILALFTATYMIAIAHSKLLFPWSVL